MNTKESRAVITILGCGNSTGVPAIGNYWGDCDPGEPKNTRSRSSAMIQKDDTTLIIDTGPDFRNQLNRENINAINAVLYTHHHSDHTTGIDELRVLKFRNNKEFIPIYANAETLQNLEKRYDYVIKGGDHELYPPIVKANEITPDQYGQPMTVSNITFTPFEQDHGSCKSIGYRFGDTAYSLDMLTLDAAAINTLKGIKNWIVDCAAYKSTNQVHAGLDTIITLNKDIGAENVYLSSMSLSMDYATLIKELPNGFKPSFDGLKLYATL